MEMSRCMTITEHCKTFVDEKFLIDTGHKTKTLRHFLGFFETYLIELYIVTDYHDRLRKLCFIVLYILLTRLTLLSKYFNS